MHNMDKWLDEDQTKARGPHSVSLDGLLVHAFTYTSYELLDS